METQPKQITDAYIESLIHAEYYLQGDNLLPENSPEHPSLGTLTICILVLKNGFVVLGTSNCIDPKIYSASRGRALAFADARDKIWELEGYALRSAHST